MYGLIVVVSKGIRRGLVDHINVILYNSGRNDKISYITLYIERTI